MNAVSLKRGRRPYSCKNAERREYVVIRNAVALRQPQGHVKELGEIGDLGASLDHKIPVTKGGSNQKDNLQWVSYFVNSAKGNKTHDEFIEFCKQIVNLYER